MKRNILLFGVVVVFSFSFWIISSMVYGNKPGEFLTLHEKLEDLNEQLITAQILSNKLNRVYTLFERNLALSRRDSLAEDASLPFLNTLTNTLEHLHIRLLNLEPKARVSNGNYSIAPYNLTIECSFEQFGQLVSELEKSPRLISIEEFTVKNPIERIRRAKTTEDLNTPTIQMKIQTITLIKSLTRRF